MVSKVFVHTETDLLVRKNNNYLVTFAFNLSSSATAAEKSQDKLSFSESGSDSRKRIFGSTGAGTSPSTTETIRKWLITVNCKLKKENTLLQTLL